MLKKAKLKNSKNPTIQLPIRYVERTSNRIEKAFNETFSGWKDIHQWFRMYFLKNPSLKAIELTSLALFEHIWLNWVLTKMIFCLKFCFVFLQMIEKEEIKNKTYKLACAGPCFLQFEQTFADYNLVQYSLLLWVFH